MFERCFEAEWRPSWRRNSRRICPAIGATAGAAAAAAGTGAAIGAASGGVVGITADAVKADEHKQATFEGGFVLPRGKSGVIAELSEQWPTPIDTMAASLGGTVYRRSKSGIRERCVL